MGYFDIIQVPDLVTRFSVFIETNFDFYSGLRGTTLNPEWTLKWCLKATGLVLTDIDVSEVLIKVK